MTSNFLSHKNHKSQQQYKRSLRVESLEERALLSAVPLSASEYADLRAQYSEFNLPQNMADVNVITLDLSQGDNLSSLKTAISTAGQTTKSDLIVVRTTDSANTLKYTSASNELIIEIDATQYGSVTIVGLGTKSLTFDANQKCRAVEISGSSNITNITNLGGMTFINGMGEVSGISGGVESTHGGAIRVSSGSLTISNSTISGNKATFGGGIYSSKYATLTINNCKISNNTASTITIDNSTSGSNGGGIDSKGILTITNSELTGNTAIYGGGILIDGSLTITGSVLSGNTASFNGGGIANFGSCDITDCTITNNSSTGNEPTTYNSPGGAGIYNQGEMNVSNSTIKGNTSQYLAGGIYNRSTLTTTNCRISNNTAHDGGGGFYNDGYDNTTILTINDCTISGNTVSSGYGGGIRNNGDKATITISNSVVASNRANYDGSSYGGGIYNGLSSTINVSGCTIADNTADQGGGIYNYKSGNLSITGSRITDNTGTNSGGGIFNRETGILTLTNSLIAKNQCDYGGAIFTQGKVAITNCTITGNKGTSYGGIFTQPKNSSDFTKIYNSIIAGNQTSDIYSPSIAVTGYNNISSYTSWSGSGNITHDGSKRMFVNFDKGDYRLCINSQAINKGSNSFASNARLTVNSKDPYGVPRFDGTIDIGANEFQSSVTYSTVVTTLDDSLDPKDNKWSLREAIYYAPINNATGYPTITFANNLSGQIDLTLGELEVLSALAVNGDGRITIDGNKKSRVFNVNAGTTANPVILNGLTIQNGNSRLGGGIYNNNSSMLTITDSIISGNSSSYAGGGIFNRGTLALINSTVSENTAEHDGGGINNQSSSKMITVTNCVISGNSALYGGGIHNYTGTLVITDSTIVDNSASNYGGGIHNYETLSLTNSTISENHAEKGGGIYNEMNATVTITNSSISNNTAYLGGGVCNYKNATFTIASSYISNNTGTNSGGGIYNWETGSLTLTNSLIANNQCDYGGAILTQGKVTITNCTITGNKGTSYGGIYTVPKSSSDFTKIYNSIIAGNQTSDIYSPSIAVTGYNNISTYTSWSGSGNITHDGSKRMFVDAANGDYHLARGSQAIDKGKNSLAVDANGQALAYDLDNLTRIVNGTVDMGAYEYRALTAPMLETVTVQNTAVSCTWDTVPNASGYQFEYKAVGEEDWTVETVEGTTASFTGTLGNEYTVRVKALSDGDYEDSEYSAELTSDKIESEISINAKKVTVSWLDDDPAADSVRYRVAGTTKWTTKKLKAGVTTFTFNAKVGTDYDIEVLRNQSEDDVLQASAVVLDQAKLKADKKEVKDDTFQVSVTNYTAKNLAANAKQAILTINGVKTVVDIANQQGTGALANGGNVAFSNGLFTFTDMNSNTQYKVQVSFSDGLSVSTVSSNLSVKTLKAPYLAPVLKTATATSATTIQVEWTPSVGKGTSTPAQYYTVQYSLDGVHWKNATTRATGTSFTIMRLKANTQYLIAVVATKDQKFNASVPSNTKLIRTMA